uniref:Preprotein-translocase subunit g n=1 Tax=Ophidocladus simpliciusculus TaxID=1261574 RepID=A0A1Z1MJL6_9FLOR|nr:preprotein-translocase subunit g [Ophidocladus simpliciusculus]ARW66015.1 preprotein-translocase subunit g [Ophidocladus simpliciusculus]
MIKLFWYVFSILTILLILINNPSSNNKGGSTNQIQLLNFRSNSMFIQKLVIASVVIFFILTIVSFTVI